MFDIFHKLSIKGRKFAEAKAFDFFSNGHTLSLVFGRNGTGKSTIAEGFRRGTEDGAGNVEIEASLIADGNPPKVLNGQNSVAPAKIFVFNEEYIDKSVRLAGTGLKTIVLMGEGATLYKQLGDVKDKKAAKEGELQAIEAEIASSKDQRGNLPSQVEYSKLLGLLKKPSGWSDREQKIKGLKIKAQVSSQTLDEIVSVLPVLPIDELQRDFAGKLAKLEQLSLTEEDDIAGWPQLPKESTLHSESEAYREIMSKTVNRPIQNGVSERIMLIMQQRHQKWLLDAKGTFESGMDYCPYCGRDISENERKELIDAIDTIINVDAQKFSAKLSAFEFSKLPVVPIQYQRIAPSLYSEYNVVYQQATEIIQQFQNSKNKRLENVYETVEIEEFDTKCVTDKLNSLLSGIMIEYNKFINIREAKTRLRTELSKLNREIAFHEIAIDYKNYTLKRAKEATDQAKLDNLNAEIRALESESEAIRASLSQVKIAADEINKNLARVFLSAERMNLHYENGAYVLKIKGKNVRASQVSTGERNALALCYFFVDIMRGQKVSEFSGGEYLIVLDDPVSSFDNDIRLGITSFLVDKTKSFVQGNANTLLLFMTHDYYAFYGLYVALKRIKKSHASNGAQKGILGLFELREDAVIVPVDLDQYHEYLELFRQVYNYAKGGSNVAKITIGNVMRRL